MKESTMDAARAAPRDPNPDRLLAGEDPETRSAQQVSNWITAYSELLAYKDRLLVDMEAGVKELSPMASSEIRELDINMVKLQRKRYESRLAYWEKRQEQLRVPEATA